MARPSQPPLPSLVRIAAFRSSSVNPSGDHSGAINTASKLM